MSRKHVQDYWYEAKITLPVCPRCTALEADIYRLAEYETASTFYQSVIRGHYEAGTPLSQTETDWQSCQRWLASEEARIFGKAAE